MSLFMRLFYPSRSAWHKVRYFKCPGSSPLLKALSYGCRDRSNIFPGSVYRRDLFCQHADRNEISDQYCVGQVMAKASEIQNDQPADDDSLGLWNKIGLELSFKYFNLRPTYAKNMHQIIWFIEFLLFAEIPKCQWRT